MAQVADPNKRVAIMSRLPLLGPNEGVAATFPTQGDPLTSRVAFGEKYFEKSTVDTDADVYLHERLHGAAGGKDHVVKEIENAQGDVLRYPVWYQPAIHGDLGNPYSLDPAEQQRAHDNMYVEGGCTCSTELTCIRG